MVTATIAFTRLHGGVASAPVSESPFSGDDFSAQKILSRKSGLGAVEITVVVGTESIARCPSAGVPHVETTFEVFIPGRTFRTEYGTPSIETLACADVTGTEHTGASGHVEILCSGLISPDGVQYDISWGKPLFSPAWTVWPSGMVRRSEPGEPVWYGSKSVMPESLAAAASEPGTARVLGIAAVVLRGHVREVSAGLVAVSCRKAVRIRHAAVVYPWRKIPACIDIHKSLTGKGSRQIHLRAVIIPYKVMDTMRSECKRGKDEPEH